MASVKWLTAVTVTSEPFEGYQQRHSYRFRQEEDERSLIPNPLGLDGVFEPFCPPYYDDMTAAVEAFCERKYGAGGPYNAGTPGACGWRRVAANWTEGVRAISSVRCRRSTPSSTCTTRSSSRCQRRCVRCSRIGCGRRS